MGFKQAVCDVLEPYHLDDEAQANLRGYYDVEPNLGLQGVDRPTAMKTLIYLKADNRFREVIGRFGSSHSPSECRRFDLY